MTRTTWLLIAGCVLGAGVGRAQDVSRTPAAAHIAQHVVVKVEGGNAKFKRLSWQQFAPLRFGTVLQQGDLIDLPLTASVTIVCDGFATSASVGGPGIKPVPCGATSSRKPTWWRGTPILPTAHIDLPTSKDLTAQVGDSADTLTADTFTFETKPEFYWLSVPGAESYTVEITGERFAWKGSTKANMMTRGLMAPTLENDTEYQISVTPVLNSASASLPESTVKLLRGQHFTVARKVQESVLAEAPGDLAKLGLSLPVTEFLQARVLASAGSYDAAIQLLQRLQGSLNVPARGRALGDVYAAKGSLVDAETALAAAAAQFDKDGDTFGLALTDEAIASVENRTAAKRASAIARLRAALKIYQTLGDTLDATRVRLLLAVLEGSSLKAVQ